MRAVEFHSIVEDGHIAVPKTFHLADGLSVRVLILLDEAAEENGDLDAADAKTVWGRTAGAWLGGQLIRESQHHGETVQMQAPVSHSKDPDLQKAPQALMRASEKARKLAEQTGTPFVVRKSATADKQGK